MWKRGDAHPLNDVTDTTRLSLRSMSAKLSATSAVRLTDVPVGVYISTANWLRSAAGISFCGTWPIITTPAAIDTTPRPTVTLGCAKQTSKSLLYDFWRKSRKENGLLPSAFVLPSIGLRMNQNCMNGTSNVATKSETISTMVTPHGNMTMKSLNIPVSVMRNGKNVTVMARVAEKMDLKKWVVLCIEACQRDSPVPRSSR